jgi:hypothetical protein
MHDALDLVLARDVRDDEGRMDSDVGELRARPRGPER